MNKTRMAGLAGAATLALGVSVAFGLPAQAKDGSTAQTHGSCSATSTYKLVASGHKDSIKVKAKAKTDVGGELWTYSIADNGSEVVAGDATTSKGGKLTIRQTIPNLDGADTIDFTATDSVTGETCVAQVTLKA